LPSRESILPYLIPDPTGPSATGLRPWDGVGPGSQKHVKLDIKAPPNGTVGLTPLAPLYKVEHAFAQPRRWRPPSRR